MNISQMRTALLIAFLANTLIACGGKAEEQKASEGVAWDAKVICSYAPSQSAVVSHMATLAGGTTVVATAVAKAAGLTAVTHSSGAYIFTGSGGYLAGTLGSAVTEPILIGVSLAVAGLAATLELLCAPLNHPELSAKVTDAAKEFYRRSKRFVSKTVGDLPPLIAELGASAIEIGDAAVTTANRVSASVAETVRKVSE